jgi:hypothetical protein
MVIPPILPLAILFGLNISVYRLNKQGIFTFQVGISVIRLIASAP